MHFRKILKTALVGSEELGRFWVMNTLSCLGSIPPTMPEKLEAVRLAIGPDGVHFTESGRLHLFTNLAKTIIGLQDGTVGKTPKSAEAAASVSVPGRRFYWRGFNSDRGSTSRPNRGGPAGSRGSGDALREAAAQPGVVQDGAGSTATTRTTWDEAAAATSFDFDTTLQPLYSFLIYIFK